MKDDWLHSSLYWSAKKADFYSGARKIIRGVNFSIDDLNNDLTLDDCGFTKSKMTMLVKNYLNVESHDFAQDLWERRLQQGKYGSVGFSTYNHLVKGSIEKRSKRASVMGPCIQSVVLTLNNKDSFVDIFYRTTELYKKFPADLVFIRDVLIAPFELPNLQSVNFHFANVTLHPMYFITMVPLLDDPVGELERIKVKDRYFYDWIIKWSARYICDEHLRGIQKFSQAMRVRHDALDRFKPSTLVMMQEYFRENHPGYRHEYVPPEGDDNE